MYFVFYALVIGQPLIFHFIINKVVMLKLKNVICFIIDSCLQISIYNTYRIANFIRVFSSIIRDHFSGSKYALFVALNYRLIRNSILKRYYWKKSGVALTQLSLTLHYSRRVFYYQFHIHVKSFFSMLYSWWITCFYSYWLHFF